MRRFRAAGIIGWLAGVLVLVLLVGAGVVTWLLAGSRFVLDDEIAVAGAQAPMTIRFDDQARPYVRAKTLDDAMFAQGFLHARERLWQMDLMRRAGGARLAELLGPGVVDTDVAMWRAGVPELARRLQANASSKLTDAVAAYTRGVNAGIQAATQPPPEYLLVGASPVPWKPLDSFALGALMAFDSSGNYERELLRLELAGELDPERLEAFSFSDQSDPGFPYLWRPELAQVRAFREAVAPSNRPHQAAIRFGSNGWVVGPERSATGRALFAFDSHDLLSLPNLFYEVHLFFAQERQLRGWSVPGLPGVINGFNRQRAWGFTNIGDSQDLVLFESAAIDERVIDTETTTIPVANGESVTVERKITAVGPLISEKPPLALRWTAQDLADAGMDAMFEMNLARSQSEFIAAMKAFPTPVSNVTWAEAGGDIGFRTIGRLPTRRRGDGLMPQEDDGRDIWRGRVPVDEMPTMINPERGFVGAANARVHDEHWPWLVSNDNAPGWRVRRIEEVLAGNDKHDLDSMAALQTDALNMQARSDGTRMMALVDTGRLDDEKAREALEILLEWIEAPFDHPDSAGALIFESWYLALVESLFAPVLSDEAFHALLEDNYVINNAVDRLLDVPESPWWRGDRAGVVTASLGHAVRHLSDRLGLSPDQWQLADRQQLTLRHELAAAVPYLGWLLDRGPFSVRGGHATVGRAGHLYDRPFDVRRAATVRVVLEMTDPIQGRAVIPGGQSGRFYSGHYDDQLSAWVEGDYFRLYPSPEALDGPTLFLRPAFE